LLTPNDHDFYKFLVFQLCIGLRFSKSKIDEFYKHKIINFQMLKTEIVVKGRRHTSCSSPPPQT